MSDNWTILGNGGTDPQNFLGTTDSRPLVIKTNGAVAMHITPGTNVPINGFSHVCGNVGIGIEQPEAKLHVDGHFNLPQVEIRQTIPAEFARRRLYSFFDEQVGRGRGSQFLDIAANDHLNFFSPNAGNVMSCERILFSTRGGFVPRVGIATETPQTTLDVNGVARVAVLEIAGGGNLAESFAVEETEPASPTLSW